MKILMISAAMICALSGVAIAESREVVPPGIPTIPPGYSSPELEKKVLEGERKVREKMEKYGINIVA